MDILDILLDILLKPPQPLMQLFLLKLMDKNAIFKPKNFLGLALLGIISFNK